MARPGTLTLRLVAFAVVWIAGALVAGGILLASLFEDQVNRTFNHRLEATLETLVAATDVDKAGQLRLTGALGEPLFERPFSGLYWQINEGKTMRLASRSLWDQVLNLPAAADGTGGAQGFTRSEITGPRGQHLRVIARNITFASRGPTYTYAVAGDLAEVAAELRPFMVTLIWSLGVLGAGLIVAVAIQVYVGLFPLSRLRDAIGRIREGQAVRLEGDFPSEVRPLVDEANQLIAHIDAVVDRARTHVGNLAHALKTPLSVLANEAARNEGPFAETVRRETAAMRERIDHHLARARTAATARVLGQASDVGPVVDGLARALAKMFAAKSIDIRCETRGAPAFRGDANDLEEMLGNLMENACKWAERRVRLRAARGNGGRLAISIEDDGPGLGPEDREVVLTRGKRLDETVPGSGLGLAIVAEIAELYDGTLELADSELGGLCATLDLPAATRPA